VRAQPEQQAPPVQRLRIRYAKRGRLRFTSHRDFSRAFERAVARAGLPMAYSSGFHPHPRISYAGAAPTGAASEAEYVEIGLAQVMDAAAVADALAASLPDGLDVLAVVESPGGSLADRLTASRWIVTFPSGEPDDLAARVAAYLDAPTVVVERMTKKGLRSFDSRAAVVSLAVGAAGGRPALDLVLRHTVPAVRPDDVLTGLRQVAGAGDGSTDRWSGVPLVTRLEQGPLDESTGTVGDPFESPAGGSA
jgi:radical SAM-linked protein